MFLLSLRVFRDCTTAQIHFFVGESQLCWGYQPIHWRTKATILTCRIVAKIQPDDRLRLENPDGHHILDLEKYFKDKELLVFYAGSEDRASMSLVPCFLECIAQTRQPLATTQSTDSARSQKFEGVYLFILVDVLFSTFARRLPILCRSTVHCSELIDRP